MILNPEKFKAARGEKTIAQVALEMGKLLNRPVSYYTIRKWEAGESNPTEELFEAYRQVVGKSKKYFMS